MKRIHRLFWYGLSFCLILASPIRAFANGVSFRITSQNENERSPLSVRITWIGWDSAFRHSNLRIGDQVIAMLTPKNQKIAVTDTLMQNGAVAGGMNEEDFWEKLDAHPGDLAGLVVLRDELELPIYAELREEKFYTTPSGQRALGDHGPDQMATDGFTDGVWSMWYEEFLKTASQVLGSPWNKNDSFDNRKQLASWLEVQTPRLAYLAAHHSGTFTSMASEDFQAVKTSLMGTLYTLTPESQVWRAAGHDAVVISKKTGLAAISKVLAENPKQWTNPFPIPNPVTGNVKPWIGKWVALPRVSESEFITDTGKSYLVAGSDQDGYYLVPAKSPKMDVFFDTFFQFKSIYANETSWEFLIYGKVIDDPHMVSFREAQVTALLVEPFAVYAGNPDNDLTAENPKPGFFVDLRSTASAPVPNSERKRFAFAGEDQLPHMPSPTLNDHASPSKVMEAMIEAVKYSNIQFWSSLFAPWSFYIEKPLPPFFNPQREMSSSMLQDSWNYSRALLVNREDTLPYVEDIRVLSESKPQLVFAGDTALQIPRVEQATVIVEHIGKFGDEYRSFTNFQVKRVWQLQRLDQGPWRVTLIDHF